MTLPFKSDNSTYVVKYMNLMGRAGLVRVILHLCGADYKNEFVTMDQVAANKNDYPFGHVPVLVETRADGTTFELAETIAIEQYLAEKFGLLGSNPQEAALYRSVALNIYLELFTHFLSKTPTIQEAIKDPQSVFNTQALPQFIATHERWLNKNGNNGHYFGDQLTLPDLVLLNWVRVLEISGVQFKESSPIKKVEQTIKAMKEWKGQYDAYHPFSNIEA
ncbi:hypothetical protein BGZ51_003218 [Haplosporangium sp. Z 767]|nr:hypothetical protein BGZ50_004825 [Haplosporangium sp. Z 11]KAF9184634.1 hypothetical protein BGZ51_003218 [Haplosporangium sp. Z 767]